MRLPKFFRSAALAALVVVVPLHVVQGTHGEPRLGVDLTIGADAVQLLVDTGSPGLRLLAKALHPQSASRTGQAAAGGYGSGLRLQGEEALATLAVGPANGDRIPIELVDNYWWANSTQNGTPEMFGQLFPGIIGIDLVTPPRGRCCMNPLPALAGGVGKRYIVHAAFDAPQLELNPDDASVKPFTMVDAGDDGWPNGCIRVDGLLADDVCGEVIFDTGASQLVVNGTGINTPGVAARGSVAHLRVAGWSHDFTAGRGLRVFVRNGPANRIIVGLAALQQIDLLFDFDRHQMGLRSL